eukprot:COSAG01_NODE_4_length_55812_cov_1344.168109_48_plen_330_part_00
MSDFLALDKFQCFLNFFSKRHVLLVGDIMLDEYHYCDVTRISPEAPVPVCAVQETRCLPGGAANVAHNLAALGSGVKLCGLYGKDSTGQRLISCLKAQSITVDYLFESLGRPTILKSRVVSQNQQILRIDREEKSQVSVADEAQVLTFVKRVIGQVQVLILSDYAKGLLTPSLCQQLITLAKTKGVPVIVDPKGHSFEKYRGATLITPNFKEFQEVVSGPVNSESAILSEAQALIRDYDLEALLVTRAEKGMSVIGQDFKDDIQAFAREVADITGAGDTVIAVFSLAIACGLSFQESACVANMAAAIVVGKFGSATVSKDELVAFYHSV